MINTGIGDEAVIAIIVSIFERAQRHPADPGTVTSAQILRH
jgi:hypothetical protein